METALVLKFIRHLQTCTEAAMSKVEVERYDIDVLRRELRQMQQAIDGRENVDPVILDGIFRLNLRIDENLLADSMRSKWLFIFKHLLHHSLLRSQVDRRQEKVKQQLKAFHEDLDHLRFALER